MKSVIGLSPGFDKCKKATLQNNYFWEMPSNDCFCLVSRTSAIVSFLEIDVINISKIQQINCCFTENTFIDFWRVIYENVEKNPFISQDKYLHKFYEVLFCTYCKGLFCYSKTVIMLIFLWICINTPNIRKWERTTAN